jgi:C1A family cysteine protease
MRKRLFGLAGGLFALAVLVLPLWAQTTAPAVATAQQKLPEKFDLRTVGAVTPIKSQQGGTCWTHGTMAAIESNLLISGRWASLKLDGIPAMSEYHLDWWNGFNKHKNDDTTDENKGKAGLTVHQGGDYRVSAAYISRGDGVVVVPLGADSKPDTTSWYGKTPALRDPNFKRFYVRDIEWFTIGDNLEGIDAIKERIMKEGAIGTAYTVGPFLSKEYIQYQPKDDKRKPNHAVAIIGWDDTKISADPAKKAPKPGAWLMKNSWGKVSKKTGKSVGEDGYFWISYYDKVSCRDPEMGAVSFRNIEPMQYDHVYYHDYHGWRDTLKQFPRAMNAFTATGDQQIKAVSFYTAANNVTYTVRIYTRFANGKLEEEVASKTDTIKVQGFHTVDLAQAVPLRKGDKFYIDLHLSQGGHAIDRTSEIPVLLGQQKDQKQPRAGWGPNGPMVISKANAGESYYFDGVTWQDLYNHKFENPNWATFDRTANFCMKALTVNAAK